MKSELAEKLAPFATADLIAELVARCSPAVFIGTKYEGQGMGFQNFTNFCGDPHTCYGMTMESGSLIQASIRAKEKED